MLLIWDIHINSTIKDSLISELDAFIEKNPEEKNIVFVGDFVYHFNFDKAVLVDFFAWILWRYSRWKSIYLVAWNHDRVWKYFVYQEIKDFSDTIKNSESVIRFFTEPTLENIEWHDILFMPYSIDIENLRKNLSWLPIIDESKNYDLLLQARDLQNSTNKNEQISWLINEITLNHTQRNKNLIMIHHFYVANTKFPGQKAVYHFKDCAISEKVLDIANLKMISGHIHKSFQIKNYLCIWSSRNTSPSEIDETKFLWKLDASWDITLYQTQVNPNILLEIQDSQRNREQVHQKIHELYKKDSVNSAEWLRNIKHETNQENAKNRISIIVNVDKISEDELKEKISDEIKNSVKEIKFKKKLESINSLIDSTILQWVDLQNSLNDRKNLAKTFINNKYKENAEEYLEILRTIGL